ncbi:AraC family transcriptional regulator [Stenotrophomonas maltophilia]|uniref:helix-turn-helix transcriptional regulator n=1 Tax=Stenotrophomonas maltophilia TaxID=40324 RepID=UPI003BA3119F
MSIRERDPSGRMASDNDFWRDPQLPWVESRRACNSRACYRPHSHPTWSIGAVDAGESIFSGAPGGQHRLQPGTLVIVPAHRVHACNPAPDTAWSYQMLHLDAAWMAAVMADRQPIEAGAATAPPIRIDRSVARYRTFCDMNDLLFSGADPAEKEAAVVAFIDDLEVAAGIPIPAPHTSPELRRRLQPAFALLDAAPVSGASLADLATCTGMNRHAVIRAFRSATGLTPHAWQLNRRVNAARERLGRGQALADVAHALGFADQSHFQRLFKAHAGITPGRYRR